MPPPRRQPELGAVVVPLLRGVIYREDNAAQWAALLSLQARVRDHVAVLGLALWIDEAEGYAFVRSHAPSGEGGGDAIVEAEAEDATPRLVMRRALGFTHSLLLALLRKRLAEFDAVGGDTRLVLPLEQVVELMRVFMPETSNEARLVDQVETLLNKVVEQGFVRKLKPASGGAGQAHYEVRRILRAYVDGQWLAGFDERLAAYLQHHAGLSGQAGHEGAEA